MDSRLERVVADVRGHAGLFRKNPIGAVVDRLNRTLQYGQPLPGRGDDAAVIPWNGSYLLLAADGMMTGLLVNEPYAAGKAAVMATVNDIYAMGGRPLGMVNVLASGNADQRDRIVRGIEKGCHKLRVPMLGGHLHPDAPDGCPSLSVAILGHADKLLRSHLAAPGDHLIAAVDLNGRAGCRSVVSWDANSGKTPAQLLARLEVMPRIAEQGWSVAAKDISNAGLLGTAAIMMENSGTGAVIHIDAVPKPDGMALEQWVLCFQSYGFILSVPKETCQRVVRLFSDRGIAAGVLGRVTDGSTVEITGDAGSAVLFDFDVDRITGIGPGRPG